MIMNTHETYVSLETAKLLKQAGFDWKTINYYYGYDDCKNYRLEERGLHTTAIEEVDWNNTGIIDNAISGPTLAVAQRWLREAKHVHIEASPENDEYTEWLVCVYDSNHIAYSGFSSYESALEAGIKKVLEIILKEN